MKLNIAYPDTGCQKTIEIEDEKALLPFIEKRMGQDVPGDSLGEEFKGYVFRVTGGNDKQGFPMMQGIMRDGRVRILFKQGMPCYRARRKGQMKRRSVRGCVVDYDLAIMSLKIVRKGPSDIAGLTDEKKPRRLGPKRAGKIRKMYNLTKFDDVRKFVVRRKSEYDAKKGGAEVKKTISKAPRIQRLVTQQRLQHKRHYKTILVKRSAASKQAFTDYKLMLDKYKAEQRLQREKEVSKTKAAAAQAKSGKTKPTATDKSKPKAKVSEQTKTQPKAKAAQQSKPKDAPTKSKVMKKTSQKK